MKRFSLILATLLCFNCTVDEDYNLKYSGDKLVLNGIINTQQKVQIDLSRSSPPSGEVDSLLHATGATVVLHYDGGQETLVETTPGIYVSPSGRKPEEGGSYFLTATLDGYPDILTPETVVPLPFPLEDLSYREVTNELYRMQEYEISLTINDDGLTKDYYELVFEGYHALVGIKRFSPRIDGDIGDVQLPCQHGYLTNILYDDDCFNGKPFNIKVNIPHTESIWTGSDRQTITYEYILIKLRNVSPSYFKYKESSLIPEGIDYAFFEPKSLYNNVEGGYGTWSAVNETVIRIP